MFINITATTTYAFSNFLVSILKSRMISIHVKKLRKFLVHILSISKQIFNAFFQIHIFSHSEGTHMHVESLYYLSSLLKL